MIVSPANKTGRILLSHALFRADGDSFCFSLPFSFSPLPPSRTADTGRARGHTHWGQPFFPAPSAPQSPRGSLADSVYRPLQTGILAQLLRPSSLSTPFPFSVRRIGAAASFRQGPRSSTRGSGSRSEGQAGCCLSHRVHAVQSEDIKMADELQTVEAEIEALLKKRALILESKVRGASQRRFSVTFCSHAAAMMMECR